MLTVSTQTSTLLCSSLPQSPSIPSIASNDMEYDQYERVRSEWSEWHLCMSCAHLEMNEERNTNKVSDTMKNKSYRMDRIQWENTLDNANIDVCLYSSWLEWNNDEWGIVQNLFVIIDSFQLLMHGSLIGVGSVLIKKLNWDLVFQREDSLYP